MTDFRQPRRYRLARTRVALGACALACAGMANAEVVQGRLELQWGDPQPASGHPARAQLLATLVTDDGGRVALNPVQARRAAGDLYALSNRRIAASFVTQGTGVLRRREVEVIVPADRPWQRAPMLDAAGRAMADAAVLGNTRWVTLMCKFSDVPGEQKTAAFFTSQYGTQPGQLGHYWKEVSYGKVDLAGSSAYGWFTMLQPRSAYISTVDGKDKANLNKLFEDCAAVADAEVDFSGVQGVNMMFNDDLDGYAWGGGACAMLDGVRRCPRVTWNPPWSFSNLAPLAHEMGHGYGLPHSDNSDGDDDPYDNPWDVMSDSWSNAVEDATYGTRPKHINIQQRDRLGWVDAVRKVTIAADAPARRTVALDFAELNVAAHPQLLVLATPASADPYATIIYTVEARRRGGDYEAALAGDAVIIHRVEDYGTAYSIDADVPPADRANNEGSMFKVGETWHSPDRSQWLRVQGSTATGFLLSVGPKPRITGGRLPPQRRPMPAVARDAAQPADAAARAERMERRPTATRSTHIR